MNTNDIEEELDSSQEHHRKHEEVLIRKFSKKMNVENAEIIIIAGLIKSAWYAKQVCDYLEQSAYAGRMKISDKLVEGGTAVKIDHRVSFFIGFQQKYMVSSSAALSFSVFTLFYHFRGKHPFIFEFEEKLQKMGFLTPSSDQTNVNKVKDFVYPITNKFIRDIFKVKDVRRIINRKNIEEACVFLKKRYDDRMSRQPLNTSLPAWHDETFALEKEVS